MKKTLIICLILALLSQLSSSAQDRGRFQGIASVNTFKLVGDVHCPINLSMGWRFNNNVYAGLGSGVHILQHVHPNFAGPLTTAIPFFADIVAYNGSYSTSPFFGLEIGGLCETDKSACNLEGHHMLRPWLNGKVGVDIGLTRDFGIMIGVSGIYVPAGKDSEYALSSVLGFRF